MQLSDDYLLKLSAEDDLTPALTAGAAATGTLTEATTALSGVMAQGDALWEAFAAGVRASDAAEVEGTAALRALTEATVADTAAVRENAVAQKAAATATESTAVAAKAAGTAQTELAAKTQTSSSAMKEHGVASGLTNIALLGVGLALVDVGQKALGFSTEWQQMMTQVQGNTLLTQSEMKGLGDSVTQEMSRGTAGFTELAHGAQYAADYGYRSLIDNSNILDEAQKKVTSSGGDASQVASVLALTMHEYGAKSSEAAQYTDVMTIAAARGRMTFEGLAESGGKAIGIAANLKVPIDQVTAAISALTQHGYDAATASTQVTAILTHIIHPAAAAADAFDALATKTGHHELASKNLINTLSTQGLTGIIADLKDAYQKMGYTQDQATGETMNLLAAQRGGLGMASLLGTANKDFNDTLAAQADVLSGKVTPTQDSYTESLKTNAVQSAIAEHNVQLIEKAFGDGLNPELLKTTTAFNDDKAAIASWNTVAGTLGGVIGGAVHNFAVGTEVIGNFGDTFKKGNVIFQSVVDNTLVGLGVISQKTADAATQMAVDWVNADAIQAAAQKHAATEAQKDADAGSTAQIQAAARTQTALRTGQDDGIAARAAAARVGYANGLSDQENADDAAAAEARAAGTEQWQKYVDSLNTGNPAIDAYLHNLEDSMDIQGITGALGQAAGDAFSKHLMQQQAEGMLKSAAAIRASLASLPAEMQNQERMAAADMENNAKALISQSNTTNAQFQASMHTLHTKLEDDLKAHHAKVAGAHKAHAKEVKGITETQAQAYNDTVFKSMVTAIKDTETGGAGVLAATQTLMDSLDEVTKNRIPGLKDQWTAWVKAAASGNPPEAAKMREGLVAELEKLANGSNTHWAVYARAALQSMQTVEATATAHTAKVDAAFTKSEQSIVGAWEKLAADVQAPGQTAADTMVSVFDILQTAGVDKIKGFKEKAQGLFDALASDTPPTVQAQHDQIVAILQSLVTDGDAQTRLFAQKALANIQTATDAATQKGLDLHRALVDPLDKAITDWQDKKPDVAKAAQDMLALADQATAAGETKIAARFTDLAGQVASGNKAAYTAAQTELNHYLDQMLQSTDVKTKLAAQIAKAGLDQQIADQKTADDKLLADDQLKWTEADQKQREGWAKMLADQQTAGEATVNDMGKLVDSIAQKGAKIPDVINTLMALSDQAAKAGMTSVQADIQGILAQTAATGVPPSMESIKQTIIAELHAAQVGGNQELSALASGALASLQSVTDAETLAAEKTANAKAENDQYAQSYGYLEQEISSATHSLDSFKQAEDGAKAGLEAANKAVAGAKAEVQGYQTAIGAATSAMNEFAHPQLAGMGEFKDKMEANKESLTQLNLQKDLMLQADPHANTAGIDAQIAALQTQGRILQEQNDATYGPTLYKLQQMTAAQKELTPAEAIAGVLKEQEALKLLQAQLAGANHHLAGAEARQHGAQEASDAATAAYQRQEAEVKAQVEAYKAQETALKTAHDQRLQEIADTGQATTAIQALTAVGTAPYVAGATAVMTALPGVLAAGKTGLVTAWDTMFAPQEGSDNLIDRTWGHRPDSFFSTMVNYTKVKNQQWFDVTWTQSLDELGSKIGTYLKGGNVAGTAAVGGGEIGHGVVSTLASEITAGIPALEAAATAAVDALIAAGKKAAGIASPSKRVIDEWGKPITEAFTGHLADSESAAAKAGGAFVNAAFTGPGGPGGPTLGGGPGPGAGGGTVVHLGGITVNPTPGMSGAQAYALGQQAGAGAVDALRIGMASARNLQVRGGQYVGQ